MTHRFSFQDNLDTTNRDEVTINVQVYVWPREEDTDINSGFEIEEVNINGQFWSPKNVGLEEVADRLGYSPFQLSEIILTHVNNLK